MEFEKEITKAIQPLQKQQKKSQTIWDIMMKMQYQKINWYFKNLLNPDMKM